MLLCDHCLKLGGGATLRRNNVHSYRGCRSAYDTLFDILLLSAVDAIVACAERDAAIRARSRVLNGCFVSSSVKWIGGRMEAGPREVGPGRRNRRMEVKSECCGAWAQAEC